MYTRTRGRRMMILSLALTALRGIHAEPCGSKVSPIAHKKPSCPQGWKMTMKSKLCLKFIYERRNWTEARKECQKESADLVRIYSDAMRHDINDYVTQKVRVINQYWIALTYSSSLDKFTWPGETEEPKYQASTWNDRDQYPCTVVLSYNSTWAGQPCTARNNFTCEIVQPADGCPPGWYSLGSLGWCLNSVSLASYTDANTTCVSSNATVLTLKSKDKYDAFSDFVGSVWLGASDQEQEGYFVWFTGAAVSNRYYNTFLKDGGTRENCVSLDVSFKHWLDVDCAMELPFMCQKMPAGGVGAPVMEMKSRFTRVSTGPQPQVQNVYLVGDQVRVTCRAFRVPSGKLTWAFGAKDGSPFPDFQNLSKLVDNTVEPMLPANATACINQTTSIFSKTATKNMTLGYLSCFSQAEGPDPHCSGSGDPVAYCAKSLQFKVIDRPFEGPHLRIEFSEPPATVIEGEFLVALCKAYPIEDGALMWGIFLHGDISRALQYNTDPEIALEKYEKKEGKRVTTSRLEMIVDKSFEGSRIACFGYNISDYDSLQCPESGELCAISLPIHVVETPFTGLFGNKYSLLFFSAPFFQVLLCLAAWYWSRGGTENDDYGDIMTEYADYTGVRDENTDSPKTRKAKLKAIKNKAPAPSTSVDANAINSEDSYESYVDRSKVSYDSYANPSKISFDSYANRSKVSHLSHAKRSKAPTEISAANSKVSHISHAKRSKAPTEISAANSKVSHGSYANRSKVSHISHAKRSRAPTEISAADSKHSTKSNAVRSKASSEVNAPISTLSYIFGLITHARTQVHENENNDTKERRSKVSNETAASGSEGSSKYYTPSPRL
ncbi:hypothetical protein EGW08_016196 [Elysia chlorotica]|uniref:C-type lectin domain-containing protein n=1 Tax=Elysia chlorotica TaxID=188477 RepID=A0A433T3F9_ELYCH|nr:hypothetical protein EGW08_016196 [Elysia chlorotica]